MINNGLAADNQIMRKYNNIEKLVGNLPDAKDIKERYMRMIMSASVPL